MAIFDALKSFLSGSQSQTAAQPVSETYKNQQRVIPFDEMNALGKFGMVLQNTADPNFLQRYNQSVIQDQERIRKLEQQDALKQFATQSGLPQNLAKLGQLYPEMLPQMIMQQSDPMRQIQLAQAQAGLQNAQTERERQSALARLFGGAGGQAVPEGQFGAPTPPMQPQEMLMRAAQIDPNQFGSVALKAMAGGGGEAPSNVREYQYFQSLPQDQQNEYLRVKRAQQVIDYGGGFGALDPRTGVVAPIMDKTLAPADLPETKAAQALAVEDAKLQSDLNKKAKNANNTLDIISTAEALLPKATGSGLGALADIGKSAVGISDEQTQANSKLKLYSGWMVSNVPRMEGPQSDFDVQNYKSMAADVGNSKLPIEDRLSALEGLKMIQQKYANLNQDEPKEKTRIRLDAQGNIIQ